MASAYTPGLTVTRATVVRKVRRLPIEGEVLVREGDRVRPEDVVARAFLPGDPHTVNVANLLGAVAQDVPGHMVKRQGDPVEAGEVIARSRGLFGLGAREVRSPITGTVELVSGITGQVTLREPPVPVEVRAYIHGRVAEVMPREGVVVEARGALVQGIFGVGGERSGVLRVAVERPDDVLDAGDVRPDDAGRVLVGGALVTAAALRRAAEAGVTGIVVGGIVDTDLVAFVGHDIGVAITGEEDVPFTLILTEGFGPMPMAERTFRLLRELSGREASINGATQIRAGVLRPEVIVTSAEGPDGLEAPRGPEAAESQAAPAAALEVGTPVRVIREPHFGRLGVVTELPAELVPIETEARVRVVRVRLEGGEEVTIPRANVEIVSGEPHDGRGLGPGS